MLSSHLEGSPFTMELEKDLSKRQQLLDAVVVRRGAGEVTCLLPDGLDDFVDHNLITFKSHHIPADYLARPRSIAGTTACCFEIASTAWYNVRGRGK